MEYTRSVKAPQAASLRANTTTSKKYLLTIVCNTTLEKAPNFDEFYAKISKCFSSPGLLVKYSFYELQPTTFKLHVHAIVDLSKSPKAYKHHYFKKILGKGYKIDFNEIVDNEHLIHCFNYSKGVPQQFVRQVYTDIKQRHSTQTPQFIYNSWLMIFKTNQYPWIDKKV